MYLLQELVCFIFKAGRRASMIAKINGFEQKKLVIDRISVRLTCDQWPKKTKTSTRQPSLLPKRAIPQMPEGYYSSGPNPNLCRFVEEHATPYDPASDKYKVKPFDKPITTTKATAIYNMHTYWSKKPHDAIREYIKHYTNPGDIVLDPFCGSGGTALAALMEGRAAIAIDLSPAATFITASYLALPEIYQLEEAIRSISQRITNFINENCMFYQTGEFIRAIIYTERFRCSKCYEVVPFILAERGEVRKFRGRESSKEICPKCGEPFNTTKNQRMGFVPAELLLSRSVDGKKIRVENILDDEEIQNSYPVKPTFIPDHLRIPFEGNIPPRLSKNIAKVGVTVVGELFSDLNLRVLLEIKNQIDNLNSSENVKSILKLALNSVLLNSSRMYRYRTKTTGGGGFSGTYYIPHLSKCINPWNAFLEKCYEMIRGVEEIQLALIGHEKVTAIVSTETATDICDSGHISPNSIDYVFTDPPYGGTYHYGALNFVWEVWNEMDISYRPQEVVISEDGIITLQDWVERIKRSLQQIFSVLKPGRWMSLCFHGEVDLWAALHDALAEAGFIAENREITLYLDTAQKSYNQATGETSKKRDLIINFRKPYPEEITSQLSLFDARDFTTFQDAARAVLVEALTSHPGSTADRLYDELVSRLVRKGQFERHDFDELLRSVAEPVSEPRMANLFEKEQPNFFGTHEVVRWYLQASADVVDEAESAKEIAAARRLETFMARYMVENPEEVGVHYSDLFEQYLPVKDKPRRLLQEWLPEFFFKTSEGTWRPPANDQERAQLAALRSSGLLRRVKRFGNALLQGVPPHERDKPESPITLADWVRQCRRAGLYEIGRVLYEKSGIKFDGLDEVALVELEEDYQVCVRRSEVKPAKKKKLRQGELFEDAG
jgi:DNA modification methylase